MRVLAVGATGQFGGLVVPALAAKGLKVRGLVHDPAKRAQAEQAGADETSSATCAIRMRCVPHWPGSRACF